MSILKSPRFLPFLTRSQIIVLVARRVHYKDYFMIPKNSTRSLLNSEPRHELFTIEK